ncbi:cytochrome P450 [Cladorrhinum samala]|uniref:Cytochrome P450 n=1 Tax=Cladorrhinum samala TaxID=585594 RepID=A0AAV9HNU2_9PEZI|nr:cytochrome P450 [Cladorrhinum samala]
MFVDNIIPWHWQVIAGVAILGYPCICALYNLYFHPLSKVPGPALWSAFRIRYVWSQLSGNIIRDCNDLHKKYGHVVRVAPDQVSISRRDVWSDAFQKQGEAQYPKDPRWWDPLPGLAAVGIFGTADPDKHARIRKLISPAFGPRALASQEPILQQYSSLLVSRLRALVASNCGQKWGKPVDVVEWLNFTTFDIFGDLAFAESFECLSNSQYHAWVAVLFNHAKAVVYGALPNYYPWFAYVFKKMMPASMKQLLREQNQFIADRLDRRFKALDRPDAMSHIIKQMEAGNPGISDDELCITVMELVTAGSETTATLLSGTVNYLVSNPEKLRILTAEIRSRFKEEKEITLDALRNDAPYLNAVLNEGLRMAPPVPCLPPRKVPAGGRTVCGTYLPQDAIFDVQIYLMNRDPEYWHSPESFRPERWLPEASTNPKSPHFNDQRQACQPFSVGGKSCFGQHLAWAEIRLILAKLLWAFDIEAAAGKEKVAWEELKVYMFYDKKPVWVRLKVRNDSG